MRKVRPILVPLLVILGTVALCAAVVSLPFIGPPVLDRLSNAFPSDPCSDPSALLLDAEDFSGRWQESPHPRPETFLQPPFAMLREEGESSDGRLYTLFSEEGKAWAVERVYCTGNSLRGRAFYSMPGFAGYVDALAEAEGVDEGDLGWSYRPDLSDQEVSRCKSSSNGPVSSLSPLAFDPPVPESSCGLLARYGRYVVAFEIHWTDAALSREDIQGILAHLEAKISSSP